MTPAEPEILFARKGAAGLVTLNRPQALNAVTLGMVRALTAQLEKWRNDLSVTRVVVTAAGGKAFSAGGDIRALYDAGTSGRHAEMLAFYGEEYVLNTIIKHYPKPYVSLIDGICMGGGVGVSAHGSHRVAGDRYLFAMPEVGIGFFPDVGATWFLPRMPGELGAYCALTGERFGAADGIAAGIATHRVASPRFTDLVEALCGTAPVDAMLAAFAAPTKDAASESKLAPHRSTIDRLFAGGRVEDILAALDADGGEFAQKAAATIRAKSPVALKIALAQVRKGKDLAFEACMATEFRIVSRVIHGHDFYEGVRAVIVDKDNAPKWQPAALAEVSDAEVARHFAPLPDGEWQPPELVRG
ncbi:enoyl-CoA hydratase/isomerase family protein [Rhodoplanes sp. Z2-YC6860]|uniref:enoyl-CoA hydratase/isomerase family protein n=1 Tax=Rhodoplanes sp. Z2-YC6860 TaxID=674703 RepID=UPI000832ADB9|nr:enoyl-CoA hydratase/isomerase family protein [Rhodoplanes sp. Z2-YC6860]